MKSTRAFTLLCILAGVSSTEAAEPHAFQPFLKNYCVDCHGPETVEGDLRLDTLAADFADPLTAEKWAEVVNAINGHQMPPEEEEQPPAEAAAKFAAWIESSLADAEIAKRATQVVLRRMNREEYNNTIRDLVGVDFQPADDFPEDPPAGGFDNIGRALTMSPLQMELYYDAARTILDRALVEGERPAEIIWHFEPEENTAGGDRLRVKRDGNNILLNDGDNATDGAFTVIHNDAWNKGIGLRDFRVPTAGEYIIRFRAAGRTPSRDEVVASAREILAARREEQTAKRPEAKEHHQRQFERDLKHFQTDNIYNYGPPRVRIGIDLGGTPIPVDEFDVEAAESAPKSYEVRVRFTAEKAGIRLNYAYSLPRVLENFWMQGDHRFARPELLVDWIELEGPVHSVWPPASHSRLLFDSPKREVDERAYAHDVIRRFMARAYRRVPTDEEVKVKLALFDKVRADKPSFVEAIKVPLTAVLASPNFLYLTEPTVSGENPRRLSSFEIASRLSYFLWSSMPDEELFRLAARDQLTDPEVVDAQLTRMLADPKSEAFVKNFAGQWLGLRAVGANPPTETLYPRYDRHLEVSMVQESEAFFSEILRNDLDARKLIKSDFVTINERLARFYGIENVRGDAIRRVDVPADSQRGGIVTQASILCITSNGTRTSPVTRGVWVMKTLLGTDPGLPVANVGEIPTDVPGVDKATVRKRLEIHRQNKACARCHDRIDPLGFALENFNAAGQWRDREGHGYNGRIGENDPLIDASATMPDGTEFTGVAGLQDRLLENEDLFLTSLSSSMFTYALGRELGFADRAVVRESVGAMKENNYTIRSLIAAIVASEQFNTK